MKYSDIIDIRGNGIFCPAVNPSLQLENVSRSISFSTGFGSEYSKPKSDGGKYIGRNQINSICNIASLYEYYNKMGIVPTFSKEVSDKIGGYPKGVVLWNINEIESYRVVSLQDNNTVDFTISGIDNITWTKFRSSFSNQGSITTNKKLVYSKDSGSKLPFIECLSSGVMPSDGMLTLMTYLKNFGDKLTPTYGQDWSSWLTLYVSDIDITNSQQNFCIKNSRFVISPFGQVDDTSSNGLATGSRSIVSILAKKGSYWSLWSNLTWCAFLPVFYTATTQYSYNQYSGDVNYSQFGGSTFDGYIKLFIG